MSIIHISAITNHKHWTGLFYLNIWTIWTVLFYLTFDYQADKARWFQLINIPDSVSICTLKKLRPQTLKVSAQQHWTPPIVSPSGGRCWCSSDALQFRQSMFHCQVCINSEMQYSVCKRIKDKAQSSHLHPKHPSAAKDSRFKRGLLCFSRAQQEMHLHHFNF